MSVEKILNSWKKSNFVPTYWLEGEEDYYIDELIDYAEKYLLTDAEAQFNLTIFYGKDADWASIVNACKRYPMFADKQVVILKEAQHMKDVEVLEPYIADPLASTIFIVGYKAKGVDKRKKLYKTLQTKNAELLTTKKIVDGKVHEWIVQQVNAKSLQISTKAAILIEEHVGNDLNRIINEIDKLILNLAGKKIIDEDDIERFIGISKEYNVFELQAALAQKNITKAIKIIQYFEANPKAAAIQMVLPALYGFFSKVYTVYGMKDTSDGALRPLFYFNPNTLSQAKAALKNYGYEGVQKIILLLHQYDLKSKGVGDSGTAGGLLMKEMAAKMVLVNAS